MRKIEDSGAADLHCHMNVWFLKGTLPQLAEAFLAEFPKVDAWYGRVNAIGHGSPQPMDSKEALAIAARATPEAKRAEDPFDPMGIKPGDVVTVSADDYGRDPVKGEVVFGSAEEVAILRRDPQVGEVVVHFPRAGFRVARA